METPTQYLTQLFHPWNSMTSISVQAFVVPVLIALTLGLLGWKLADRIRLPAPAMIGPMLLVAIAVLAGAPRVGIPVWLMITVQSVIGGFIGRRIDRSALRSVGAMVPAILVTTTWYVAGTAMIGLLVARLAHIDLVTAFIGTAPGGVAEMTALASTSQADVALVATMQATRVLASNVLVPLLARLNPVGRMKQTAAVTVVTYSESPETGHQVRSWIFGLAASLAGGVVFSMLGVPAGGVIGSMLVIAVLRLSGLSFSSVPRTLLNVSYIVLGISVGISFDAGTIVRLNASLGIFALATLLTLLSGLALGLVISRVMRIDYRTAMLACSPGGLSLMAVVAEETGAQSVLVGLFHLVRIVWVILSMPVFIRLVG